MYVSLQMTNVKVEYSERVSTSFKEVDLDSWEDRGGAYVILKGMPEPIQFLKGMEFGNLALSNKLSVFFGIAFDGDFQVTMFVMGSSEDACVEFVDALPRKSEN